MTATAVSPTRPREHVEPMRADIQGLRAIAVMSVLLFHFWPKRLTGGYVGVDIFFVISGFLITSHLLRRPCTDLATLGAFWARRIRRLLPAATLVLVATVLASLIWLPSTMVSRTAYEAGAASIYSENWALVRSATDYLSAENAPSPVQHYWSLSVEEQFYIIWPILIGLATLLGRRIRREKTVVTTGLAALVVASLAASIWTTTHNPALAYFATQVRIWELGIGGLVALALHLGWRVVGRPGLQLAMCWIGLAMVAYSVVRFSTATAFPGSAALLPVVGTALIIWAEGDGVRGSLSAFLAPRPIQYIGDISYSIYLWHWPVIVIAPYAFGSSVFWPTKLVLVAMSIVFAGLTKRYVEDTLRHQRGIVATLPRSFAMGSVCIATVIALAVSVVGTQARQARLETQAVKRAATSDTACFGAAAARNPKCSLHGEKLITTPTFALDDKPRVYADNCWNGRPFTSHVTCEYGPESASTKVALIGNSHAGHWFPPIKSVVDEKKLRLRTFLVSECFTVTSVTLSWATPGLGANCQKWNTWALGEIIRGQYSLVVMSDRTAQSITGVSAADHSDAARKAYTEVLKKITASGAKVLILRDTPAAKGNVPDCIAKNDNSLTACDRPRRDAVEPDPLADAGRADTSGKVAVLDVNNLICDADSCHTVLGGVIVYFDHGHMTATFAQTLLPEVSAAMKAQLR